MSNLYDYDQQTKVDEFGVDHSNFSLRDEIEYNFKRAKEKERQQMIKSYADLSSIQPEFSKNEFNQYNIRNDKNYALDMPKQTVSTSTNPLQNSYLNGVPTAALSGFANGVAGGTERLINGLSGNNYGKINDRNMNNSYTNRQNQLRNQAMQAGVGYLHDTANTIIDTSADIAKYYYGGKLGNKFIK